MKVRRRRLRSRKPQMQKLARQTGDTELLSQWRRRRLKRLALQFPITRNLFLCGGVARCFLRWPTPGEKGSHASLRANDCALRARRVCLNWTQRGNSTNNAD